MVEERKIGMVLGPLFPDGTFMLLNSDLSSKAYRSECSSGSLTFHLFFPIESPCWIGTQGQYPCVASLLPPELMDLGITANIPHGRLFHR